MMKRGKTKKSKVSNVKADGLNESWELLSIANKNSIARGMLDIKLNKTFPHDEIRKLYSKWL